MDNDAGDWMSWFDMDAYLATSPQNDVQGDKFTPTYGEATFQGADDESIESESWVPFGDGNFFQDIHGSDGAMTQDPGAQPMTSTSSIDPYLSYATPPGCSCMACLLIGMHSDWKESLCCRFKDCNFKTNMSGEYTLHERDHYHEPGNPLFRCVEQHCMFATKRWPDLIRHYTVRHCTKPKQFSCPVPWCKYSGGNGFARKDKLRSHQRNVHQGQVLSAMSSSILRPIQPAMPGSGASAN